MASALLAKPVVGLRSSALVARPARRAACVVRASQEKMQASLPRHRAAALPGRASKQRLQAH